MGILDRFDRKFGRYVPDNLTNILLIGQGLSYVMVYTRPDLVSYFYLSGKEVLRGEVWRLLTVLFAPMSAGLLFALLALYFFYIFGNELERRWGSFRYLVYILIGYLGVVLFAFIFPDARVTNFYLYTSLFLAFTHLYPDFKVLLFFIIPVRMKWLGYFTWASLGVSFLFEPLAVKVLILLSVSNFLVFFWSDLRYGLQRVGKISASSKGLIKGKPNHVCAVCGMNEISSPDMEIRYCSQCIPSTCYCGEHIRRHQHRRLVD